jgi:predicted nicotinamide N-methyase
VCWKEKNKTKTKTTKKEERKKKMEVGLYLKYFHNPTGAGQRNQLLTFNALTSQQVQHSSEGEDKKALIEHSDELLTISFSDNYHPRNKNKNKNKNRNKNKNEIKKQKKSGSQQGSTQEGKVKVEEGGEGGEAETEAEAEQAEEEEEEEEELTVQIQQFSYSSVGLAWKVWDSATILARWLHRRRDVIAEKRVLEVGSGCGLAGLMAAHFAKRVTLTDYLPQILDALTHNLNLNFRQRPKIRDRVNIQLLDWRAFAENRTLEGSGLEERGESMTTTTTTMTTEELEEGDRARRGLEDQASESPFEVIIASDVVFNAYLATCCLPFVISRFLPPTGRFIAVLPKNRWVSLLVLVLPLLVQLGVPTNMPAPSIFFSPPLPLVQGIEEFSSCLERLGMFTRVTAPPVSLYRDLGKKSYWVFLRAQRTPFDLSKEIDDLVLDPSIDNDYFFSSSSERRLSALFTPDNTDQLLNSETGEDILVDIFASNSPP